MVISQVQLAARIADARDSAGLRQAELAARVGLSQSAVSRIESGSRAVGSLELAEIADALGVSVLDLLAESPTDGLLVAARGAEDARVRGVVERARTLLMVDQLLTDLGAPAREPVARTGPSAGTGPPGLDGAAALAITVRDDLALERGPVELLEAVLDDHYGIHVVSMPTDGVDGLCATTSVGTAIVVDSLAPQGRRRFTIAHELGHWLAHHGELLHVDRAVLRPQDEDERWANKFAITFLAPPEALEGELRRRGADDEGVLRLSMKYGVSYESLVWHLLNNGLIDRGTQKRLHSVKPSEVAFRCGLYRQWRDEQRPVAPTPPHGLATRVIAAYRDGLVGLGPVADVLDRDDLDDLRAELEDGSVASASDDDLFLAPF